MQYQHIKEYVDFLGVDLTTTDLKRTPKFATGGKNSIYDYPNSIKTRPGTHLVQGPVITGGACGLYRFDTTDVLGVAKTEIIGFASRTLGVTYPLRLVRGSFTITNSHGSLSVTVNMYWRDTTDLYKFTAVRNGVTIATLVLGDGREGSPVMLSSLETTVDAGSNLAMSTPTNASTTPAAFMDIVIDDVIVAGASNTYYYYYWQQVNSPASPVYTLEYNSAQLGNDIYRNHSIAIIKGIMYISPGPTQFSYASTPTAFLKTKIIKYDGQTAFLAGLKACTGATFPGQDPGTASYTDARGTYTRGAGEAHADGVRYLYSYIQVDKTGHRIESVPCQTVSDTNIANELNIGNIPRIGSDGYNIHFARVNGSINATLVITVDAGHTLKVGDIAYFYHINSAIFVQREITAVAATTITISTNSLASTDPGGTVDVQDNAVISNNLRIGCYRTLNGGSSFFLIMEIPHDPGTATNLFYDESLDANLGAEYIVPVYPHDPPPSGRTLSAYKDQLIISGNELEPNRVFFSDSESMEYHPPTHAFDLKNPCTGHRENGDVLACFERNAVNAVSGNLAEFTFTVDRVANSIGALSHLSIQSFGNGITAFLSDKGPFVVINGTRVEPLGGIASENGDENSRLLPFFQTYYGPTEEKPVFERAIGAVLNKKKWYVLFIPYELPTRRTFSTQNGVTWVYDYGRGAWFTKWTNLNMAGGCLEFEDGLFFASRYHDGNSGSAAANALSAISKQQNIGGYKTYTDHNDYIDFQYQFHWEALGQPSVYKKFLRMKIWSLMSRLAPAMALTVKTYLDYSLSRLSTSNVITFSSENEIEFKMKSDKAKAMLVQLETVAYQNPIELSGYEMEMAAPFKPKMKD